jgi:hypothetical protein
MTFSWIDLCAPPLLGRGVLLAWAAVAQARRFRACQAARGRMRTYAPPATILAPCKGLDEGLRRGLATLATLDYPRYEVIFIVEDSEDAAFRPLSEFCAAHSDLARLVVAGRAADSGQKIHNLLCGLNAAAAETEVFAFLDSDVTARRDWLAELVAPLADESVGATTGFRWYSLEGANFASVLRCAWTQATTVTLGGVRNAFAWGGSMAIRRRDFDAWNIARRWRGAVSDDFLLSEAVCEAKREIRFVPTCMAASPDRVGWRELLEFTTRQMTIAKVYYATIWRVAFVWYVFSALAFWTLCLAALTQAANGRATTTQAAALLIFAAGVMTQAMTLRAMRATLGAAPLGGRRERIAFCAAGPLVATLYAWNAVASALSRRIVWREIEYELISKCETVVRRRERTS